MTIDGLLTVLVDHAPAARARTAARAAVVRGAAVRHGRHVLPHQQAEPVGPVVPAVGLDLDVLADHVEAELLVHLQVVRAAPRRSARCSRPSGQKPWSSVAIWKTGLPLSTMRGLPSTFVDGDASACRSSCRPRRPSRPGRRARPSGRTGTGRRATTAAGSGTGTRQRRRRRGPVDRADRRAARRTRSTVTGHAVPDAARPSTRERLARPRPGVSVEPVDVVGGHRLHPDGLPDAGGRGVEDAARVQALLADGGSRRPASVGS